MTDPAPHDFRIPGTVAALFAEALQDPDEYRAALEMFSTPESLPTRNYAAEAALLASAPNGRYGLASIGQRAFGAPDVAYVAIELGLEQTVRNDGPDDYRMADAFMTLVWRTDAQTWLVHAVGARVLPENLPRYSPGEAPE